MILTISMLCSSITTLAFENENININLSENVPAKYDIELPEGRPLIEVTEDDVLPIMSGVSRYTTIDVDKSGVYTEKPTIQMPADNTLVIPNNRMVLEENWTSENEIDTEDLAEIESLRASRIQRVNEQKNSTGNTADVNASVRTASSSPLDASYRITNINSKDSFALQNQTGRTNYIGDNIGDEYIDPMTGNLIVTETDLVLPGVDGHDLKLSRYYSLAQSELYTKTAGISTESKTYVLPDNWYVVTEEIYNTETYQTSTYYYAYSDQYDAEAKIDEIETRDTCNGLFIYNAWWDLSTDGDTITFDYYITSEITSSSYQIIRNNLGAGWSWSFPSVQTIKDNYNDYNEFEFPKAIYYHDGKGNVMEVEYDDLNGCYFTNYVGQDITFDILGYYDTDVCSTARVDYMVEDTDCTEYYFGPHGEIRSIIDVHGNKIEFSYTDKDFYGAEQWPVISSITDSVGRFIDFRYTTDGDYDYVKIEVTSPLEDESTIELIYTKKMIDVTYQDEYFSTEPFLESVEYPNGEITTYYPAMISGERSYAQPLEFTFADKSFESDYVVNTSGYTNTLTYLLGNSVRPHSNTYYYYDLCERNLGHSGKVRHTE